MAASGSGVVDGYRHRSSRRCGAGGPSGLNVNNNIDNDNVGVAVALPAETLLLSLLQSYSSVGDGLNPTANHFPNLLYERLNRKILLIVDCSSIL